MTTTRTDLGPLHATEHIASVLRLAVGLLTLAMTAQFAPVPPGLAAGAGAIAVGWSGLMFAALRSDLTDEHVARLAHWSGWLDMLLALTVYAVFLPDPEATPVAALPLLVLRLAVRLGSASVGVGASAFVALVGGRIAYTRLAEGQFLIRPHMLMAWALTATLVLVLASEARARTASAASRTAAPGGAGPRAAAPDVVAPPSVPLPLPVADPTGHERLDSLAACLALKLETPQPVRLTDRELEVLVLLGRDHTSGSIASRLFISQSTVRNHIHNVRHKLDLDDRGQLLALARAVAARVQPGSTKRLGGG